MHAGMDACAAERRSRSVATRPICQHQEKIHSRFEPIELDRKKNKIYA